MAAKAKFTRRPRTKGRDVKGAVSVYIKMADKVIRMGNISRHLTVPDAKVSQVFDEIDRALFGRR